VSTCFIFFDAVGYTTDTDVPELLWAVRLDEAGEVDRALSEHTLEDIKHMQVGARTVVVLPAAVASIHLLNLPKLSMRKAREAIPYALEEALAEPVQNVHVALERDEDNPLHYRAVVLNKLRFSSWMRALEGVGLMFDAITLDWFAIVPGEVCVTDKALLVREMVSEHALNGALSSLVASKYMQEKTTQVVSGFSFDDSSLALQQPELTQVTGSYRLFIATRLLGQSYLNLCQGDFQQKIQRQGRLHWPVVCGGLLGVWFLSVLGWNAFLLHQLHSKQNIVDGDIQLIYHGFFPEATQVIRPRFRIEKLLEANTSDIQSPFWLLLNKFSNVFSSHSLEIEQFEFHEQVISVHLVAKNFGVLEAFEQALKKQGIQLKQVQASARDNQVTSTLELQL
jgi:general secretion pathway protein L